MMALNSYMKLIRRQLITSSFLIKSEIQTHLLQLRLQLTALLFFLFDGDLQGLELGILL